MSDDLVQAIASGQLAAQLATATIGRVLRFVTSTGSTNDDLRQLALASAPEGVVLIADEQTQGRGRRGRSWSAPTGSSVLMSTLLRPTWLPPAEGFYLTMLAAIAAAEAIEKTVPVKVDLKWPNDLHVEGSKLGGILVETEVEPAGISWAIIGIGLNVNWNPATLPELAGTATSLHEYAGAQVSRTTLIAALLQHMDEYYSILHRGARTHVFDRWRARLSMLGRRVSAEAPTGMIEGIADDVTAEGALVVREHSGRRHELVAGDVTIRRM